MVRAASTTSWQNNQANNMVDVKLLREQYGLDQEYLKNALGGDLAKRYAGSAPVAVAEKDDIDKRVNLRNRMRSRIDEGMTRNFQMFRIYQALDIAWDTPFRQINPTLLQSLIDKDPNDKAVLSALSAWGMERVLEDERDAKTDKPTGKKVLNLPVFIQVFVPLVKAYVTARWAKTCNDRNLEPFFKVEPAKLTMENKVKCECITDRLDVMARQFGYYETMKQAVLKMLHYSFFIQFPQEEWFTEEQIRIGSEEDVKAGVKDSDGKAVENGKPYKKIVKEGLRFHLPHPSRIYRDLAHPLSSLNTDTGCEFVGHWKIIRYRDLAYNPAFYFRDEIGLSDKNIFDINRVFFQTVFGAATMSYPVLAGGTETDGTGPKDREKQLTSQYYGNDYLDQGILVTEHFEKINPKRDGLVNPKAKINGGYDCPVWFRFLVAGTTGTIIYATPLPSCPATYAGYDANESNAQNASMSLETLPFQDAVGNVLSQMLLSMKQNLANLVLVDADQVSPDAQSRLQNFGEKFWRALNIQFFSGTKAKRSQHQTNRAIESFSFPKANLQEAVTTIKLLLDLLERVLVISSQEVAQAASHEQTREEIRNIKQTSSSRQQFTAKPIDVYRDAWRNQIYNFDMAFGTREFMADVPCDSSISLKQMEAWGFTFVEKHETKHGADRFMKLNVKREHVAVPLWSFANNHDGDDRTSDASIAQAMAQFVQAYLANPMTAQAIGPEQAISIANIIMNYAGMPRDFKLRSLIKNGDGGGGNQQQAQAMLQEVLQQVGKAIQPMGVEVQKLTEGMAEIQKILGPVSKTVPALEKQLQQTDQALQELGSQVAQVERAEQASEKIINRVLDLVQNAPIPKRDDSANTPPTVSG
jgi:hypothetical protein